MKYHFSKLEREKICKEFENGTSINELGEIFGYSGTVIKRILIETLGLEKYTKIAKEHLQKIRQENMIKRNKSEKGRETSRKNGKNVSSNQTGEKNPNWKNGISSLEFNESHGMTIQEWKKSAQKIRKRDKFICQFCGKKHSIVVHHIIPRNVKINNSSNNLITLCEKCHPKVEHLTDKYLKENRDPIEIFYEKWSQN